MHLLLHQAHIMYIWYIPLFLHAYAWNIYPMDGFADILRCDGKQMPLVSYKFKRQQNKVKL